YLLLGKKNFLDEYKNNKITSLLMINKCQTSSLKKIEKLFKKENILVISHKNFGNEEYLNQYQHIGYEYDELIIFINKNMFYDSKSNCLMYSFDEISEYALMYDCLYLNNLVYFDALFTWLVVAFTRATKSIRIFVDENNPDKENICKYFNDRIDELENNDTKN
ncbi:MAG: hypothetical protein IIT97_02100, partial [Mycoplasmataceae bacterium]|nr:hypothetical protein [Mycoplasmataceae bacterium]